MASVPWPVVLSAILFTLISSTTPIDTAKYPTPTADAHSVIRAACNATRYPDICYNEFHGDTALDIIQSAIKRSSKGINRAKTKVKEINESASGNLNISNAATNCLEMIRNSEYRIQQTRDALDTNTMKNARAWMSATLSYEYACWNWFKYANDTVRTAQVMSLFDHLMNLTSNALSMIACYDNFGGNITAWSPPKTERDGFWEKAVHEDEEMGSGGGVPPNLPVNAVVCKHCCSKGDHACFKTVQEAVNAAPDDRRDSRFVIYIKEGVYEEKVRVPLMKRNVVFLGDGMGKTVITANSTVGTPGVSTYNTATVGVIGDGFMASNLTIRNTAGSATTPAAQAVAFRSDSDMSVIQNCEFTGNQDTLYASSLRQYYKSCLIQGNVDFIFGNSAAFFEDCEILIAPRQKSLQTGEKNAITAHGRTDPSQSTGFVFLRCNISGTDAYMDLYRLQPSVHHNFLGRPWKEFSRTVFIHCFMEEIISPPGWLPWSGDFAFKTLYYGEFGNQGPGSNSSGRVTWSSQIPPLHVPSYSVENFIQGDSWIPLIGKKDP